MQQLGGLFCDLPKLIHLTEPGKEVVPTRNPLAAIYSSSTVMTNALFEPDHGAIVAVPVPTAVTVPKLQTMVTVEGDGSIWKGTSTCAPAGLTDEREAGIVPTSCLARHRRPVLIHCHIPSALTVIAIQP